MLKVVYPGTFDPITRGHEDLVRRAASVFDNVVVAVAESQAKGPFFTAVERVEMAAAVLEPYPNVTVASFILRSSARVTCVRATIHAAIGIPIAANTYQM